MLSIGTWYPFPPFSYLLSHITDYRVRVLRATFPDFLEAGGLDPGSGSYYANEMHLMNHFFFLGREGIRTAQTDLTLKQLDPKFHPLSQPP